MTKKQFNNRFKIRPLSYSQLSTWEWSQDEWYERYILDVKEPPTPAMEFGTLVGDSIGTKKSMVPTLTPPGVKEYELRASLNDIHLIGFADHYCDKSNHLEENKTSDNPLRWDQQKVNDHKQMTMYALLLYLQDGIPPEEVTMNLNFIPVEKGQDFQYRMPDPPTYTAFKTKRTTQDIVEYSAYIIRTVDEMYEYVRGKRL